jgi:hypothetical protein
VWNSGCGGAGPPPPQLPEDWRWASTPSGGRQVVGPILYGWWLWHIWVGDAQLALKLFWTFAATVVLGGPAVAPLTVGRDAARRHLRDLFGTTVITDRRIAWLTPWRARVYREIAKRDVVAAALVEGDARRGWITVTECRDGCVTEIDLHGVPQPAAALAAIERLIDRSRLSPR